MSPKAFLIVVAALMFPQLATAQQSGGPDPCAMPAQAAVSAAQIRDEGKPKSYLEEALPARDLALQTPTGSMMYSVLDDVYKFADIAPFPHYYFRRFTCILKSENKPTPASFDVVYSDFRACQDRFGREASEQLGMCLMKAIIDGSTSRSGL